MKYFFTLMLLGMWLLASSAYAQKKSQKVYVASVGNTKAPTGAQLKRRNDEIIFQAKNKVNNLLDLLNTLTSSSLTESERNSVTQNSYLPNQNQIFYNDGVVIEDDIDPRHISSDNTADLVVDRYLRNLDLFYTKADTNTIFFSQVLTSAVIDGPEYPYIKVFFSSSFRGKHNQVESAYQPVHRVAELKAELIDGKWRTFITRLAFLRPGEGMAQLTKPTVTQEQGPSRSINSKLIPFIKTGSATDTLIINWDSQWLKIARATNEVAPLGFYRRSTTTSDKQNDISFTFSRNEKRLTFKQTDGVLTVFTKFEDPVKLIRRHRLSGWSQIAAGLLGLGASYAGYSTLQNSYNDYTAKLTSLNAEYNLWKTLTQQSGGGPPTTLSFNDYSTPGIYGVYGGGAVSSGLIVNGIRQLLKAGKMKRQYSKLATH
ncbi:hypothetical protein [Spirosoma sp. 48-14]|uniref:hypothetical protein n=1 Tax=Spirosoma sp. 48-14 TaxID=1895854 RepID=UPI00096600A1|nr:hypothetical protein [Spirosoma sp. 48-14]OJW74263.1 MAG: hypothetical protein BGO59_14205 [Spirosoma sp. 48-14]